MQNLQEALAVLAVLAMLIIVPVAVFSYEKYNSFGKYPAGTQEFIRLTDISEIDNLDPEIKKLPEFQSLLKLKNSASLKQCEIAIAPPGPGLKVLTLTGMGWSGTWTTQPVMAHNYWRTTYKPYVLLVAHEGDEVLIRLKTADVYHYFTIPPSIIPGDKYVQIPPGYVTETSFKLEEDFDAGSYTFACHITCGKCHKVMNGTFLVLGANQTLEDYQDKFDPARPEELEGCHSLRHEIKK
ncbi:MAG: hypothetical protein AAB019_03995 [Planctomycetota bacterium]